MILEDSEKFEPRGTKFMARIAGTSVVTVVCMEGGIFTVSVENSEVESVSMIGLLKGEGEVVTGLNMVSISLWCS